MSLFYWFFYFPFNSKFPSGNAVSGVELVWWEDLELNK